MTQGEIPGLGDGAGVLAVDVIIPVHTQTRPIGRAVRSVLAATRGSLRVTVVAHNIDAHLVRANLGELLEDPRVRVLDLADDLASPAGPMNLGLAASSARFVSVLGSDDEFEPGAIDSWLALQAETGAAAVLPRIAIEGRGNDPYPPVRWGRRQRDLDPVRDRLAYRSAPLGLIDRERFADLRFTVGLASGEDLAFSTAIWFSGEPIAYDLTGPAYVVHDDAGDRVTFASRPVSEDFRFLDAIESSPWFPALSAGARVALAVKLMRVHLFDAILARLGAEGGFAQHRDALVEVAARLERLGPGSTALLSRADRAAIDELSEANPDPEALRTVLQARWNYRSPGAILPRGLTRTFAAQAPLRTLAAGFRAGGSAR